MCKSPQNIPKQLRNTLPAISNACEDFFCLVLDHFELSDLFILEAKLAGQFGRPIWLVSNIFWEWNDPGRISDKVRQ